jgi:hypothetical protein
MCEPIQYDGREYHITEYWTSWNDSIEISGPDCLDPDGGKTSIALPSVVAMRVAAAILRRFSEHLADVDPEHAMFIELLDGILSMEER